MRSISFYRATALALTCLAASIAHAQDGIPDRTGQVSEVNVTYTDDAGNIVSEIFAAPVLADDFGEVPEITGSTIDALRQLEKIPSFGLAKFHWWLLGGPVLQRAQRQYAGTIERIKLLQRLLGETLMIDDPRHPLYIFIISVREYSVPFEPIQREGDKELQQDLLTKPPTRYDAISHALAAIDSINVTVQNTREAKKLEAVYLARYQAAVGNLYLTIQNQQQRLNRCTRFKR